MRHGGCERQMRKECQGECGVWSRTGVVYHSHRSWNDPKKEGSLSMSSK